MALDLAQARVMGKLMRDLSYMDDLWRNDGSGKYIEEERTCDNFDDAYLADDKYSSVLMAIMGKAGRIRKEVNERISWGGHCAKIEVLEINLNCSSIAPKAK